MSDREHLANRFSSDVDLLLQQQERIEGTPVSAEYGELLQLAERLARLDLSADTPLRDRLRQQLWDRYRGTNGRRRVPAGRWRPPLREVLWWPRWNAVWIGIAMLLLCVVILSIYRPTRVLAQEAWQDVLRTVRLIRALPSLAHTGPPRSENAVWGRKVDSPVQAASLVDWTVRIPSYLPQGYEFRFGYLYQSAAESLYFDYGIPWGRIVVLPDGRVASAATLQGIQILQQKGNGMQMWPIGDADVGIVQVNRRPAAWVVGLPVIRSEVTVVSRVTVGTGDEGQQEPKQEIVSRQEPSTTVLAHPPTTALMWEEGDLMLGILDLDGRLPVKEMIRIAEGLVPVSTLPAGSLPTPTPWPETIARKVTGVDAMVAEAAFAAYVLDPLPQGWTLERITALERSEEPLERRYLLSYRSATGAEMLLIEAIDVALGDWTNYIERGGGILRHVAGNGLEVWTSPSHQENSETSYKESARLNDRPLPEQVLAMFVRAPDGFVLEVVIVDVPWEEVLSYVEQLVLAPGADPSLNSRLLKGCHPCP